MNPLLHRRHEQRIAQRILFNDQLHADQRTRIDDQRPLQIDSGVFDSIMHGNDQQRHEIRRTLRLETRRDLGGNLQWIASRDEIRVNQRKRHLLISGLENEKRRCAAVARIEAVKVEALAARKPEQPGGEEYLFAQESDQLRLRGVAMLR